MSPAIPAATANSHFAALRKLSVAAIYAPALVGVGRGSGLAVTGKAQGGWWATKLIRLWLATVGEQSACPFGAITAYVVPAS